MYEQQYPGNELNLFKRALNWKNYWLSRWGVFIGKEVIEVGAGNGTNAQCILSIFEGIQKFTALEPDSSLFLECQKLEIEAKGRMEVIQGTLTQLDASLTFDTIFYIDVMEHLEEDAAEFELAYSKLKEGGYLMVLVPAHNFLFSDFDTSIGHYRRYNKNSLLQASKNIGKPVKMEYLDAVGLLASLANKYLLKQTVPTLNQILFWDRCIIPISKIIDPIFSYKLGKTLIAVWKKES